MASFLRITIRYLQPLVHGRSDGDEPEWPPSPLRLFQAMVAAAAARWNERIEIVHAVPALRWFESGEVPEIVTCKGVVSTSPRQCYVPDNSADTLVPSWKRGEVSTTPKRTEKVVRPVHLDGDCVHYFFRIMENNSAHIDTLRTVIRSVTHLGWGIDVVVGDAELVSEEEVQNVPGQRWKPAIAGGVALRVPIIGTLDDLMRKHSDFLNRISDDRFRPVPPLRCFEVRRYRRSDDRETRPFCAFQILKPDASGIRAFHTPTRARDVAAWIRHAVSQVCKDWPDLASFVHGHGPDGKSNRNANSNSRFQYLPLPTVNSALNRVESIRRVMIVAPPGCQDRIDFIRRRLVGFELKWQDATVGILNLLTGKDFVQDQYLGESTVWSTVTPAILDGFDDRNPVKTEKLIRKALLNAKIVDHSEVDKIQLDWQPFGFLPGVESVNLFKRPENLHGTMVHVQLRFQEPRTGPIAIGAGRYRGFGLMVKSNIGGNTR